MIYSYSVHSFHHTALALTYVFAVLFYSATLYTHTKHYRQVILSDGNTNNHSGSRKLRKTFVLRRLKRVSQEEKLHFKNGENKHLQRRDFSAVFLGKTATWGGVRSGGKAQVITGKFQNMNAYYETKAIITFILPFSLFVSWF